MPDYRIQLDSFLRENAKHPQLIDELGPIDRLELLFVYLERRQYLLQREAGLDSSEILDLLSRITDKPVHRISFVSVSRPFPKPDWMTQDVFGSCVSRSLGVTMSDTLQKQYGQRLSVGLGDPTSAVGVLFGKGSLGDKLRDELRMFDPMFNPHKTTIMSTEGNGIPFIQETCMRTGVSYSLFSFLGLVLIEEKKDAEMCLLLRLIDLLPNAIPIGMKNDEPGTWIVLCA